MFNWILNIFGLGDSEKIPSPENLSIDELYEEESLADDTYLATLINNENDNDTRTE